jgi:hypothetical protein
MNQKINIRQPFLGILFSLLYCLTLQRAIKYFLIHSNSKCYKNRVYCFSLQNHCFSIANTLLFYFYFLPVSVACKFIKRRVLYYLIMSKFYNSFKFKLLQNFRIPDSIINLLLIHYYFHYYSLLIRRPFLTGPPGYS